MANHRITKKIQKKHKKISKRKSREKFAKRQMEKISSKIPKTTKKLSKTEKINKNRQKRLENRRFLAKSLKMKLDSPKLAILIPISLQNLEKSFETSDLLENVEKITLEKQKEMKIYHLSENFNNLAILDASKISDLIIIEIKVNEESEFVKIIENSKFLDKIKRLSTLLISQGCPNLIVLLNCGAMSMNKKVIQKRKTILKRMSTLFSKFFNNKIRVEFKDNERLHRILKSTNTPKINWRDKRTFLVADQIQFKNKILSLEGILRGDIPLNPTFKVHLTGFGDFEVLSVEKDYEKITIFNEKMDKNRLFENGKNSIFGKNEIDEKKHKREILEKLKIDEKECQNRNFTMESKKLDIKNEVLTPVDKPARLRFYKYRGLQSLAKSPWRKNPLPKHLENLFSPQNFGDSIKNMKKEIEHKLKIQINGQNEKKSFKMDEISPWQRVKINVKIDLEMAEKVCEYWNGGSRFVILSSLFEDESIRSVVHFKIKKKSEGDLHSKKRYCFHCGFRRYDGSPLFSKVVENSDKFLYEKKIEDDDFYVASLIAPVTKSFDPVILTDVENDIVLADGIFDTVSTERTIIKKIVLTGYPIKVNKNKAVVRYMFFSPLDIKWFSNIELHSKSGLIGNIKESVGTHGNMKCLFSDFVKSNDIICMPLYKQVYPPLTNK